MGHRKKSLGVIFHHHRDDTSPYQRRASKLPDLRYQSSICYDLGFIYGFGNAGQEREKEKRVENTFDEYRTLDDISHFL